LRALTGIDADRLPEERRRGMTIDVGYAHLTLPDGGTLDFVDVPGHDRLVGNMLVGAGEIDAAMLVVAADDGPRAQTLEHLELLDGLAIGNGVVVVTKTDAVDAGRVAEVEAAARALVATTSLGAAPVLSVSATTGAGLDDLRDALAALSGRLLAPGLPAGPSRLAIDRVFRVKGRGIVVTGTLRGSSLEANASLAVVPGGGSVRVRELQVHGQAVERAEPGRVAINVAGADGGSLVRGTVLTTDPATIVASDRWLVALRPVTGRRPGQGAVTPDRTRGQVHLGTSRTGGVVGRAGRDGVGLRGAEVSAILRLETPLAVTPGDRFVLRRPSPAATLAGGRVLDPAPARGVSRRRTTTERLVALADAAPSTEAWAAARLELHGSADGALAPDVAAAVALALVAVVDERTEISVAELRTVAARLLRRLVSVDTGRLPRLASDTVDGLIEESRLIRDGDRIRPLGATAAQPSAELRAAMDRLEAALATVAPPSLSEAARATGCPPAGIRELERSTRIVRLGDDLAWAFATYRRLAERALAMATAGPLTPAAYRDATGTSRKYVMAILEDLDRRAILRRTPEGHVPGPRASRERAPAQGSRS
ncbi:MAG TPA: selenocysteine-specific translation elongation factor, partial [Candidatus Limnocylindrales bacterium]|nr:selenocysteine-specific translation elongation factor [Candidatus Limnocylindrales bacterium]